MCRERDELEDALDVALREARLEQAVGRALADEALRAGAGVDPRRLDADHSPDAALRGCRDPDQAEHRLGGEARHGRAALDGVPGSDPRLRPAGALPLDDLARNVRRQLLDEERLLEHDVLDHFLEELREAGHVDALLRRVEVDGALDVGGDQLLAGPVPDPDRLRDSGDPRARQAEANLGLRRLEVFAEQVAEIGHPDGIMAVAPNLRTRVASQSIFAQLVSLACHDLRTPLATASGFAHTLQRLDSLEGPADRYVDMIGAASDADGRAARPPRSRGTDRGRPLRRPGARGRLARARRCGRGASGRAVRSRTAKGRPCCSTRPGRRNRSRRSPSASGGTAALDEVTIAVDGSAVAISPLADGVGRDSAGRRPEGLRRRSRHPGARRDGTEIQPDGERLVVRLPQA